MPMWGPYGNNRGHPGHLGKREPIWIPYVSLVGPMWVAHMRNYLGHPIWVLYGYNLGKRKWEINVNTHMGPIWDKPGGTQMGNIWKCPYGSNMGIIWETQMGNMCKCPYGFIMGSTWGHPNGKQIYERRYGSSGWDKPGETQLGNISKSHLGQLWEQSGQTLVGKMCKCPYGFIMGWTWVP